MSRIRLLAIGTTLLFAAAVAAQQATTSAGSSGKGMPTVEDQLKVLTGKLDLTADQQDKIRPIMQKLHDATEKLLEDETLSREERLARVRPERYKADKQIREILSDDQKKKLDQYLQGPHREMHGDLTGSTQQGDGTQH